MNLKTFALSGLMLFAATGCAHRVVYTETYEREPVVVHRTVVVNRRPHYYHRPYERRVVVVARPTHYGYRGGYDRHRGGYTRDYSRRDGRSYGSQATVSTQGSTPAPSSVETSVTGNVHNNVHTNVHSNVHIRAEASTR